MKKNLWRFNKVLLLTVIFQLGLTCHAQYEIFKAKTVDNDNIVVEQKKPTNPTYNDPELPNFSKDQSISGFLENKTKNFFENRKRKKYKKQKNSLENKEANLEEESAQQDSEGTPKYKPREIDNEVVIEDNKFQINADKMSYNDEDGNVYAKGNVEIISLKQGVTLKADDAILDKTTQTIKLTGNVKVIKEGVEMAGEYLVIDLNEQNILMDNPVTSAYQFEINAQEGYLIANDIQMVNGSIKSSQQLDYSFETGGFQRYENIAMDYRKKNNPDRSNMERSRKQVYRVEAKKIILTSYKDHNTILLKGSDVYYNKLKILFNSDIEIISDKEKQVVDMSSPEAGTLRNFGAYIGYGWVTKLPQGQTLKLMPAFVYGKSKPGVGLIARYRTQNNLVEAGWATSSSNLVVRGRYRLTDDLNFRYGRNAYLSDGFMGARRSGYAAQLEYRKSYIVDGMDDLYFNHGIYAGFFTDYRKHHQEKAYGTTRFRYSAELRKTLFEYQNSEQDLNIKISALAQGAATLYGSGQTQGVVRIGPYLTTKMKFWESSIGYMIGGVHGDSPFVFDKYRYGKSTVLLNEKINFGDKFAIGFRANVSPLKDNYEKKLLTESRVYAIFGPQDLKLVLSYDFVRDIANLEFMFLLGTESSQINFKELITKDMQGGNRKQDFYKSTKRVKVEPQENI